MSKNKDKLNSSNTLFNYFSKSPATPKIKPELNASKPGTPTVTDAGSTPKTIKQEKITSSQASKKKDVAGGPGGDNDEDDEIKPTTKRRRILMMDDDESGDSDGENRHKNDKAGLSSFKRLKSQDAPESPVQKKIKTEKKKKGADTDELDDLESSEGQSGSVLSEPTVWFHEKLDFLKPDKIKDIQGNKPGSSNYDSRTLYVPESFLNTLTPAMRQWWELKSHHMDCVLFFKVGKFYELFHMDAIVGVQQLEFCFMKGEIAHSGFPEHAYERMSSLLIEKGFKVARVEQTETPEMMQERCKKNKTNSKFDKVVRREICQLSVDGAEGYGQQAQKVFNYRPKYMLAVTEKIKGEVGSRYGVCFIDTTLGIFHIGEFEDDDQSSRFLTLLSHYPPTIVLHERNAMSATSQQIFKTVLSGIRKEALTNDSQYWSPEKTLKYLAENFYGSSTEMQESKWPEVIRLFLDKNDHLGLTPDENFKLALKALGGCIWYLKRCLLDQQVISLASFELYIALDEKVSNENLKITTNVRSMVLDSVTLGNLRVTDDEQSLESRMDHCCTKFGKRLFHHWICSPSCERGVILERQEAVTELLEDVTLLQGVRQILGELPDLERMLAQIHTFGNAERNKNHPDGRAILYEEKTYGKKKIQAFIKTLRGFKALTQLLEMFSGVSSKLLARLMRTTDQGGLFPDVRNKIRFFEEAFDHEKALEDGVIAPKHGLDAEYDVVESEIKEILEELEVYKRKQEKYFGCKISYFGSDDKRFQLKIPETASNKASNGYTMVGQKKGNNGFKMYHTEETRDFLKRMISAETQRKTVLKDLSRRVFEKFASSCEIWRTCTNLAATLDCLTSLAEYARSEGNMCIPEILEDNQGPVLELEEGVHPCVSDADNYIPNGINMGGDGAPLILLTGPNMGGKSTLMRQVGLLAIMAQIGSRIPARSCRMTLIDRIFTRLGAKDDIMAGRSTFLVELNETATILKHATKRSLVFLDELGRGTGTTDGTSIAGAVVNFIADKECRCIFSTHYHNVVESFSNDKRVRLGHMSCMVENEDAEDPTEEMVTFLYKYANGAFPKSYGFNTAKLAGMPACVIKRANELSKTIESRVLQCKIFSKSLQDADHQELKDLLYKLKACRV